MAQKIIVLDDIFNQQVKIYLKIFWTLVTVDEHKPSTLRYVFTPSRIRTNKPLRIQINHPAISNALPWSFKKAKVGTPIASCLEVRKIVKTISDVDKITKHQETDGAFVLTNEE